MIDNKTRSDCEKRLTAIEEEAAQIKKLLAEPEVQWVEVHWTEGYKAWSEGKPAQVCGKSKRGIWSDAKHSAPYEKSTDILSAWHWRIPSTDKKKRVVLEGEIDSNSYVCNRGNTDYIAVGNSFDKGDRVKVTIEEA